jgi:predicted dehydrogenase
MTRSLDRVRVGIVGCGDVVHRHYLPALASMADHVTLAAVADPRAGAGEAVAAAAAAWSPGTAVFRDVEAMLRDAALDAVFNVTPAPMHGAVNRAILDAGVAVYSEKPVAASVAEADGLIELAAARGLLFLCAPGSAVTNRMRWLWELARSGRLGAPTLAVAHHADPGPAAWDEYTGDPTPFYREGVGPVFDHGVYRLHEMTTVLGPVRRVQAMGSLALPTRRVRGGPLKGKTIEVTTLDHVLIHLEFASGALGQLLASFATADTLAPWLELHLEHGVVSFGGKSWEPDAPVLIYDATDASTEEWKPVPDLPRDDDGVVEMGARHFIACLLGTETPILTAEHARHVLDVILQAYASIADGRVHDVGTTFAQERQDGSAHPAVAVENPPGA